MNLDVYYCTSCSEELAVKIGKEPNVCTFCTGEVTYSHTVDLDKVMEK